MFVLSYDLNKIIGTNHNFKTRERQCVVTSDTSLLF